MSLFLVREHHYLRYGTLLFSWKDSVEFAALGEQLQAGMMRETLIHTLPYCQNVNLNVSGSFFINPVRLFNVTSFWVARDVAHNIRLRLLMTHP